MEQYAGSVAIIPHTLPKKDSDNFLASYHMWHRSTCINQARRHVHYYSKKKKTCFEWTGICTSKISNTVASPVIDTWKKEGRRPKRKFWYRSREHGWMNFKNCVHFNSVWNIRYYGTHTLNSKTCSFIFQLIVLNGTGLDLTIDWISRTLYVVESDGLNHSRIMQYNIDTREYKMFLSRSAYIGSIVADPYNR